MHSIGIDTLSIETYITLEWSPDDSVDVNPRLIQSLDWCHHITNINHNWLSMVVYSKSMKKQKFGLKVTQISHISEVLWRRPWTPDTTLSYKSSLSGDAFCVFSIRGYFAKRVVNLKKSCILPDPKPLFSVRKTNFAVCIMASFYLCPMLRGNVLSQWNIIRVVYNDTILWMWCIILNHVIAIGNDNGIWFFSISPRVWSRTYNLLS